MGAISAMDIWFKGDIICIGVTEAAAAAAATGLTANKGDGLVYYVINIIVV